ncbi:MAG: hypothetical protein IT310_04350 [Anaerolineales bacterium]|nr:hypothetical protein [Anaerolineales bacterium]
MRSRSFIYSHLPITIYLICAISLVGCGYGVLSDVRKEGISLEEAQELLLFQICLPDYVPNGVTMSNSVLYHAEFGDPNESDVTIDYVREGDGNLVFSVYERNGTGREINFHDNGIQRVNLSQLLDWQVDWETIEDFDKQYNELEKNETIEYEVYDALGTERLLVEITSPKELKSVSITWRLSQYVLIDIYSFLSVEETKLIANSVPSCSPVPTATP